MVRICDGRMSGTAYGTVVLHVAPEAAAGGPIMRLNMSSAPTTGTAVVVASAVMYFPLLALHQGNINIGGIGFGDPKLSAPQAGLMASLAQGIVGGDMAWPLIITGILMGVAMIMIGVKSPMLVAIGNAWILLVEILR